MQKKPKSPKSFVRYSSLAFEMIVLILAGVFGGFKLDKVLNSLPVFTILLSLTGVILALYFALKDFLHKP